MGVGVRCWVSVRWGMVARGTQVYFVKPCEANDLRSADKVGVSLGGC